MLTESDYRYEKVKVNNDPSRQRECLPNFDIQSINQQPLHRGGRSNPNQYVFIYMFICEFMIIMYRHMEITNY